MKYCSKCKTDKFESEFNKDKDRKSGLRAYCRDCDKVDRNKWHKKNYKPHPRQLLSEEEKIQRERDYRKKYRESKKTDPLYRLQRQLRKRLRMALKERNYTKKSKSFEIIGCDINFLVKWIESKFTNEMNWQNYGTIWHLDHKIPLNWAKTEDELLELNHYTNLQPLLASINMSKQDRFIL